MLINIQLGCLFLTEIYWKQFYMTELIFSMFPMVALSSILWIIIFYLTRLNKDICYIFLPTQDNAG